VNETFDAFLQDLTDGASYRSIAERSGLEQTTLTRQLKGELKVHTVVAICRAYRGNLLRAFVAAGFITEREADSMAALAGIAKATDTELAEEILKRVKHASNEHPVLTNPLGDMRSVGGDPEDLSEMDEDALKRRDYDLAANTDESAERLDPEDS
jgi:hypothetical protein